MASKTEYTKKLSIDLELKPKLSTKDMRDMQEKINHLSVTKMMSGSSKKAFGESYIGLQTQLSYIKQLSKAVNELSMMPKVDGAMEAIAELNKEIAKTKEDVTSTYGYTFGEDEDEEESKGKGRRISRIREFFDQFKQSSVYSILSGTLTTITGIRDISSSIESAIDDALDTLNDIADYSGSSYKISTEAIDWLTSYGLSGEQAYAWQEVLDAEGLNSLDSLISYIPFMTDTQIEYMQYIYDLALENYETSTQIAEAYQEFQLSWEQFQNNFTSTFLEFFAENETMIENVFDAIISIADSALQILSSLLNIIAPLLTGISEVISWVADAISAILDFFTSNLFEERTDEEVLQDGLEILGLTSSSSSISYNITYDNSNVDIDTSFTGVSRQDQAWLSDSYSLANSQVIKYLNEN